MTETLVLDSGAEFAAQSFEFGVEATLAPGAEQLIQDFEAELAELDTMPSEEVERANRITMDKEFSGSDFYTRSK